MSRSSSRLSNTSRQGPSCAKPRGALSLPAPRGHKAVHHEHTASRHLRDLVRPLRLRVTTDAEGYPVIPGRYGVIEWFDGRNLAVYSDRPRLFAKIWAIPGVHRHQTGDDEMRATFPPEALERVAAVIQAKRWGGSGRGRPQNLVADARQTGTSAA